MEIDGPATQVSGKVLKSENKGAKVLRVMVRNPLSKDTQPLILASHHWTFKANKPELVTRHAELFRNAVEAELKNFVDKYPVLNQDTRREPQVITGGDFNMMRRALDNKLEKHEDWRGLQLGRVVQAAEQTYTDS